MQQNRNRADLSFNLADYALTLNYFACPTKRKKDGVWLLQKQLSTNLLPVLKYVTLIGISNDRVSYSVDYTDQQP